MRSKSLSFWAGKKAYAKIMESGLKPEDVDVIAGAAGGPKWLVLNGLDRAIFTHWIRSRKDPLFLIGASIGSWRFAAVSQADPAAALDRFETAYLAQAYPENPPPEVIDHELARICDRMLGADGPEQILSNPVFRLNIMCVRSRGLLGSDARVRLMPGLVLAAMGNAVMRRSLGLFFERTLFYDPRDIPPYFDMPGFPIHRVPLDTQNISPALKASGSIPLLMSGIRDIPGAPPGVYRDGGILDYHLNIPFINDNRGIVLFPHYAGKLVPGWLDKQVPWRKPNFAIMENVLMIAPSRAFLESLPHQKIPDRKDFYRFAGRDQERMDYWRRVVDRSRELADEFIEAVETGNIRQRLEPIENLDN
ncbi:MAG: patatin-like phospholipase family protein [Desulfosalsimonas sp.]